MQIRKRASNLWLLGQRLWLVAFFLCPTALRGEASIRFLDTPDHSAQARYDTVQNASDETLQMVYEFQNDGSAFLNAAALREKARDGKKTFLLIDALSAGHRVSNAILKNLTDNEVEIKLFHPFNWKSPLQYQFRMHDKLILVDGQLLITGGRNVGNRYYGFHGQAWRDLDVYVDSKEVAKSARDYFFKVWNSPQAVSPSLKNVTPEQLKDAQEKLDRALEEAKTSEILNPKDGRDWKTTELYQADAKFLNFDFDSQRGRAAAPRQLQPIMRGAKRRIEIITPYFAPPTELENILKEKISERVPVRIITNSEEVNNQKLVAKYYRANLRRYAKMGLEIIEMGDVTTHAKAMVVDDTALVGTFNADAISWYKNLEIGVAIQSKVVADHLHDLIEENYVKVGKLVAKDGKLMPGAKPSCRMLMWLLRPLRNHL